jgi:hypothetical protein
MEEKLRNMPADELSEENMHRLINVLGGFQNVELLEESEFLTLTRCPVEALERWLKSAWIRHDIDAVLAGTEQASTRPVLLARQYEGYFTIRLFCPRNELLERAQQ